MPEAFNKLAEGFILQNELLKTCDESKNKFKEIIDEWKWAFEKQQF